MEVKKVCNTDVTKFSENKKCIKNEMGGHKGDVINVVEGDKIYCGKKIKIKNGQEQFREYRFYLQMKSLIKYDGLSIIWNQYLPNILIPLCKLESNYMILENVFSVFGDNNFDFLDIKLGPKSAFFHDHNNKIKSIKHNMLDNVLTTSSTYGFRIEGGNITKNGKKMSKSDKQKTLPPNLWKWFFSSDLKTIDFKTQIQEKLVGLKALLKINSENPLFGSVGSSILIAHDGTKSIIKLIDFGHGYTILEPNKKKDFDIELKRMAKNNYIGVCMLLNSLLEYIGNTDSTDYDNNCKNGFEN